MNELITIEAVLIKEFPKSWYLDCEGDKAYFPKSLVNFKEKEQELIAPKWLLMEKFPNETF